MGSRRCREYSHVSRPRRRSAQDTAAGADTTEALEEVVTATGTRISGFRGAHAAHAR